MADSFPAEWARIVEMAQEDLISHRKAVEALQQDVHRLEGELEEERRRNRSITSSYEGMRKRLDMAFGAPDDDDPSERRAKGRDAGLDGAVNFAIAKHSEVIRHVRSQSIEVAALKRKIKDD